MANSSIFNTIPGDGEIAILLYGNVGANQQVDSERVVSELLALEKMYNCIDDCWTFRTKQRGNCR